MTMRVENERMTSTPVPLGAPEYCTSQTQRIKQLTYTAPPQGGSLCIRIADGDA